MPNPPTDTPTIQPDDDDGQAPVCCLGCGNRGSTLVEVSPRAYLCASCRDNPTASAHRNPLIGRVRWEAWRELMNSHSNAFAVGGAGADGVVVMAWDFLSRPLGRAEVANLIAWLLMISGVEVSDLAPICGAQGFPLREWLATLQDPPPATVCGVCGGEHAAVCSSCGRTAPR